MMCRTARSKDGTAIAFERGGDGPALILLGGALSSGFGTSHRSWSSRGCWSHGSRCTDSIVVYSGFSFWRSLMRLDLIDVFYLDLMPYVAGGQTIGSPCRTSCFTQSASVFLPWQPMSASLRARCGRTASGRCTGPVTWVGSSPPSAVRLPTTRDSAVR